MEYTLKSGKVVTDAEIEAMAEAVESGVLPGQWSGGRDQLQGSPLHCPSHQTCGRARGRVALVLFAQSGP